MGRTRAFDSDAVLAAAGDLFRQRGYRDTSLADIEQATGLVSGSIYNAFGDKAGLFRAALAHYVDGFVRQRLAGYAGREARLEDLEQLFLSVLEPPLSDGHGCLVNNSLIEFGRAGGPAAEGVDEALSLVRTGIEAVLTREIGAAGAAREATPLVILYHGILTLSRSPVSFEAMAAAVRAAFRRLQELRPGDRAAAPPQPRPGDL
ncbi:MAG TPA: TetR/AcrR family transcriptional regulator [Devosiaceae bacterium]|jgi:AcrR family transcriptional regulator|nr:TetR/AcrR family transcriptional regulator [Devosiaceae bacterium]